MSEIIQFLSLLPPEFIPVTVIIIIFLIFGAKYVLPLLKKSNNQGEENNHRPQINSNGITMFGQILRMVTNISEKVENLYTKVDEIEDCVKTTSSRLNKIEEDVNEIKTSCQKETS